MLTIKAGTRMLYLTQWYDPEPTFKGTTFTRGLTEAGVQTEVATGFPNYPGGKIYPGYKVKPISHETVEGVRITRLPLYPSHSRSTIGRILNYGSFFVSAFLYGLFRAGRYDVVYVYHPPMTVGFAAALFCALRRRPFVIEIQDLWPESITESGMGNSRLVAMIHSMCDFVYRRADSIIVQSNGMKAFLADRGVPKTKLHVVINWANEGAVVPLGNADLSIYGFENKITFLYAGALGEAQGLEHTIYAAAAAHSRDPRIQLILVGSGTEFSRLAEIAAAVAPNAVKVMPGVPIAHIADVIAAADVLLVHIQDRPLFRITIPSKTQFYLACGKPIVAALPGEAGEIIQASGAGEVVASEDADALCNAMVLMASRSAEERVAMGQRGRDYYQSVLAFHHAIHKTLAVIQGVLRVRIH